MIERGVQSKHINKMTSFHCVILRERAKVGESPQRAMWGGDREDGWTYVGHTRERWAYGAVVSLYAYKFEQPGFHAASHLLFSCSSFIPVRIKRMTTGEEMLPTSTLFSLYLPLLLLAAAHMFINPTLINFMHDHHSENNQYVLDGDHLYVFISCFFNYVGGIYVCMYV